MDMHKDPYIVLLCDSILDPVKNTRFLLVLSWYDSYNHIMQPFAYFK